MSQIEFETFVHQGTIAVPKEHQPQVSGRVRVIIITEENEDDIDMVEYLMNHPLTPTTTRMFTRDELHDYND
ncbi:hypothetical protein [Candidatus Viridilinea mediisalina]|uniref:Uncharacterized protein n=1 Tax=Candidatus Viridilinea mediisalina TaxID=2024553 RepID=A0A2A6RES3_9CHLR|nr:hypothetical protein [Candidatus Viridilinea mediisalina]PDW01512.1 hypothetical protein CJ255_18765 [Candidatus Viridilinea mediisalina]